MKRQTFWYKFQVYMMILAGVTGEKPNTHDLDLDLNLDLGIPKYVD